ncbi:sulfotransferase [Thermoleophilia bacterium SCSIO 60948]|nr:sulfotransferase [Thermoleophilia bacterium SCSIO 60948]
MRAAAADDRHDRDGREPVPIVVGGAHRSGTTLVRGILDRHSRISCGPELKFLLSLRCGYTAEDPLNHSRFTTTAREFAGDDAALEVLGEAFLELHRRRAESAGKPRWADKNPENLIYLDIWQRLLGERFVLVWVRRDPRDVLVSMEAAGFPYSGPDRFERRVEMLAEYERRASRFTQAHPARVIEVVYEDLVADPRGVAGAMMNALGERLEEGQLSLGPAGALDGLGDPNRGRWERIGDTSVGSWRGRLSAAERSRVADRLGVGGRASA